MVSNSAVIELIILQISVAFRPGLIIALFVYTLILFYVIIRAIKTFQNSKNHQKHISYVVACSKFGLLLPLLTSNAELYLFVSLTTWFLAGYIESRYTELKFEKNKSLY